MCQEPCSVSNDNCLWQGDALEVASRLPHGAFRLIYLDPPFFSGCERIGNLRGSVKSTRNNGGKTGHARVVGVCKKQPDGTARQAEALAIGPGKPLRVPDPDAGSENGNRSVSYDDRWPEGFDAYLDWLEARLAAARPLLVENGSLVVHLDHRAVHEIKVRLDRLFGRERFVNEIIWHYTGGGRSRSRFSCKHDTLLWYANGPRPLFNLDAVRVPYKPTSGYAKGGITSKAGKKYQPHPDGTPVDDVWDIPIVNPMSAERTGYPTQKPLTLLERVISALSAPGDLVGDLFCGSGTTLVVAARLGRRWLGADRSPDALAVTASRLAEIIGTLPSSGSNQIASAQRASQRGLT